MEKFYPNLHKIAEELHEFELNQYSKKYQNTQNQVDSPPVYYTKWSRLITKFERREDIFDLKSFNFQNTLDRHIPEKADQDKVLQFLSEVARGRNTNEEKKEGEPPLVGAGVQKKKKKRNLEKCVFL